MRRLTTLSGVALVAIALGGCKSPGEAREQDVEQRPAEAQPGACEQRLAASEARYEDLEKRMESVQRRWDADRATVLSLKSELKRLNESYDKLQALYAEFEQQAMRRPEVPISPLPENVDRALLAFATKLPGRVWYERERGAVSFANDRLFDSGGDKLRSDSFAAIDELAGILASTPADEFEIVVVGHTDDLPINKPETLAHHPTNWHLSVHRAIAVQKALVDGGLPASRCGVMGYAQYRPVGADRAQNRRVEIFVVPKGAVQTLQPVRPG